MNSHMEFLKTRDHFRKQGVNIKRAILTSFIIVLTALIVIALVLETRGSQLSEAYMQKIIERAQQKFNIPAISISVFNGNQILYSVCDGVRVFGTEDKISEDDYFHIGSCSKSVLACLAAKLVEKGLIEWDTKFFEIYPELKSSAQTAYHN